MARLFSYDPVTKTKRLFHWNEADESFHIETLQDVTDVVEYNKARFNSFDERANWKGDWHYKAQIPLSVLYALPREIREDPTAFKRWLNDPDQRVWHVRPGRV